MSVILFASLLTTAISALNVDPEITMTTPEIIEYWGYPAEVHYATTEDGYILQIHRISHGLNDSSSKCRPVVFMQHCLFCDSSIWVLNPPSESPGFIYADAGFDVWIGNFRGNTYGKNHTTYSTLSPTFWNFTWDDSASKDLTAMIDMALDISGQDSLYYVGHSQGTQTMFGRLSYDKDFSKKIKKFFALGPIGSFDHLEGFMGFFAKYFGAAIEPLFNLFGNLEFLPNSWLTDLYAVTVCPGHIGGEICSELFLLTGGTQTTQLNKSRAAVYNGHFPAGTSVLNMAHVIQMTQYDGLKWFSYDSSARNEIAYGSPTPPIYNLTAIETDVYLYWSDDDFFATTADVNITIHNLNPTYLKGNNELPGYNHYDFVWGLNAPSQVHAPIIDIIKEDLGGTSTCSV